MMVKNKKFEGKSKSGMKLNDDDEEEESDDNNDNDIQMNENDDADDDNGVLQGMGVTPGRVAATTVAGSGGATGHAKVDSMIQNPMDSGGGTALSLKSINLVNKKMFGGDSKELTQFELNSVMSVMRENKRCKNDLIFTFYLLNKSNWKINTSTSLYVKLSGKRPEEINKWYFAAK